MANIHVGARPSIHATGPGKPKEIKTKKALRELLSQDPTSVTFYGTSRFTLFAGTVRDLAEADVLTVCGPDPQTERRWYANVQRQGDVILFDGTKIKVA